MTLKFEKAHYLISRKLLSQRWLKKMNIDKDIVESELNSTSFITKLNNILTTKEFTCINVLDLCEDLLNKLSGGTPPDNWLKYLYEYALNKAFPAAVSIELKDSLKGASQLYLRVLRVISNIEKISGGDNWKSIYSLHFLSHEEESELENPEEYKRFMKAFKHDYIYEMMKLNEEVYGYNTLDHICGVHYLSLHLGRQLKEAGVNIDLGRVSGAAAGHDIGKYGCKGSELKRVPHLHYYYTDQWFRKFNIHYIRNIAINHSTWDLELENLSLESLILIYADFRVKNMTIDNGYKMHIYSLKDSFQVILEKLENLDEKKEKRYRRVYAKLKDFEDYLKNLGIETETHKPIHLNKPLNRKCYSLMRDGEVVQNLKYISIDHNINLMYKLRDIYSLDKILEKARSEKDWKNLREYIRVFEEYSTYLTQKQKVQTIKFLYENLVHPEDDIRRHCAELIGTLIAYFDEDYRKEIPEDVELESSSRTGSDLLREYLNLLIYPNHKIIPSHKMWIGYSTRIMVASLFNKCQKSMLKHYRDIVLEFFANKNVRNKQTRLFLLETAKYIPLDFYDENLNVLYEYIISMLERRSTTLKLSALEVISKILVKYPHIEKFKDMITKYFENSTSKSKYAVENLLKYKIASSLDLDELANIYEHYCKLDDRKIPDIFLSNLKTATNWIVKKNQIDLLLNHAIKDPKKNALHTCIHFSNLLKVSEFETVRNRAGKAILTLMPHLSYEERNELAVELLRALEIEGHKFTEYIPRYLGKLLLWLTPKELNEVIDDLKEKIKSANSNLKTLILKTIGVSISNYAEYKNRFNEGLRDNENRLNDMLGILLNGLGNYKMKVKQSSISVLGKDIFGSRRLSLEEKNHIFTLIAKKVLTLISTFSEDELLFLTHCAALNHMYRFISDYTFFNGEIQLYAPNRIAFFPGTFDPFSLSHKQIATSIRDMGFEVYLAVDEFSWSKRTLPNLLRKSILNMSISNELNIYVYPGDYPINIANPKDLKALKEIFSPLKVYMVAGSDVVANASSYTNPPQDHSIHSLPHIIFKRGNNKKLDNAVHNIQGEVSFLTLPSKFTNISSSQIRNCIDENRDISKLIDPLAQQYIYENGFYQREPRDKSLMSSVGLDVELVDNIDEDLILKLIEMIPHNQSKLYNSLLDFKDKTSARILLLKDRLNDEIVGFSTFHWVRSNVLYKDLRDEKISEYIRKTVSGRLIYISGMFVNHRDKYHMIEQILITETLAFCLSRDYEIAVFKGMTEELNSPSFLELLRLQGFIEIETDHSYDTALIVDMSNPCILSLDIENIIKEPFRSNPKVKQTIAFTRKRLQESLTKLYPGQLVLSFDSNMLCQSLIKIICKENKVPTEILQPRTLGNAMCVPYGDILERFIVPNTVTKSLHTEKLFNPDVDDFEIGQFPYYLSLENQMKMIRAFNRPVILVDNLLHKGYRMKALSPLVNKYDVKVKKLVVGILSGRGKDLMDRQNTKVKSVYFIPRLKLWLNERDMYPFIGGDALWRGEIPERNLIPSINIILPYAYPTFMRNASTVDIYDLSRTCLENSMEILSILENRFHSLNARNLILSSMGEVFTAPRFPEHGRGVAYDLNKSPSYYLKNDLEQLNRLKYMIR